MLAVITRPMVIATDAGTSKQFVPVKDAGGEPVPQEMSEGEFGRLRRAGAAARFIVVDYTMGDMLVEEITSTAEFKAIASGGAEPATGLLTTDLGSINGLGEAGVRTEATSEIKPETSSSAGTTPMGSEAVASTVASNPKGGRKSKG